MGTYVNDSGIVTLGTSYDYDDAVREIANLIGVGPRADGKYYLADICVGEGINQWAYKKSVRHSAKGNITDSQRDSVLSGLSPVKLTKLIKMSIGHSSIGSYSKEECLSEVSMWPYLKPRGQAYSEWNRLRDFDGYDHHAECMDSGWQSMEYPLGIIDMMKDITVDVSAAGDYAGYNFKMQTMYDGSSWDGGLVSAFKIRFHSTAGISVGSIGNIEIPLSSVGMMNGNWRMGFAVWIPNFGTSGGWGLFASRMTLAQYMKENLGAGSNLRELFPNFGTNPYCMKLMDDYISGQGGYFEFDFVPLLFKDLSYTTLNGRFALVPVLNVTEAYCMPSGIGTLSLICGTPPAPVWYKITYTNNSSQYLAYLENTDTDSSHTFEYKVSIMYYGEVSSSFTGSATLSAGEKRIVGGAPLQAGYGIHVEVTSQDGVEV